MDASALPRDPAGEAPAPPPEESAGDEGSGQEIGEISMAEAWLDLGLVESLRLPEGKPGEELALRIEAAGAMVAELAPAGAGERALAVHFTAAQAAALGWQAEANRRDLPPAARATAQRLACQLIGLATRLIQTLDRLQARREKRAEAAEARSERGRAVPREPRQPRGDSRSGRESAPPELSPAASPEPIPLPHPSPGTPSLNRQQRRAASRRGRKPMAMGQGP